VRGKQILWDAHCGHLVVLGVDNKAAMERFGCAGRLGEEMGERAGSAGFHGRQRHAPHLRQPANLFSASFKDGGKRFSVRVAA